MALPTPETKFYAVVNSQLTAQSKPVVNPADYTGITPAVYSGVRSQRNTIVLLDPPLSSTSVGRTTIFYDRIVMSTINGLVVEKGVATTLMELLPAINAALGITLSLTDLESVASIPASGNMSIIASATNLIYTGTLTFALAV